jgi:hypothetical protein
VPHDEVSLTDHQIDLDPEVGERGAKVVCDPFLTSRSRQRLRRPQIVANVVLGEDLEGEVGVATIPDLLVEAPDESLVSSVDIASLLSSRRNDRSISRIRRGA